MGKDMNGIYSSLQAFDEVFNDSFHSYAEKILMLNSLCLMHKNNMLGFEVTKELVKTRLEDTINGMLEEATQKGDLDYTNSNLKKLMGNTCISVNGLYDNDPWYTYSNYPVMCSIFNICDTFTGIEVDPLVMDGLEKRLNSDKAGGFTAFNPLVGLFSSDYFFEHVSKALIVGIVNQMVTGYFPSDHYHPFHSTEHEAVNLLEAAAVLFISQRSKELVETLDPSLSRKCQELSVEAVKMLIDGQSKRDGSWNKDLYYTTLASRALAEYAPTKYNSEITKAVTWIDNKDLFEGDEEYLVYDEMLMADTTRVCLSRIASAEASSIVPVTLFVSYTAIDAPIADLIIERLEGVLQNRIKISRYTDLDYKDSFKEFMDSIPKHDYVLCIVSDTYLKRHACIYEINKVISCADYKERCLFVVLSDEERSYYPKKKRPEVIAPNIHTGTTGRLTYLNYWKDEFNKINDELDSFNNRVATRIEDDKLAIISQIIDHDLEIFMDYLDTEDGKSFAELESNNFAKLIKWMIPEYEYDPFKKCDSFEALIKHALAELKKLTKTDYNQVILDAKLDTHHSGLVVAGDDIDPTQNDYRVVAMDGIIKKAHSTGEIINVPNIKHNADYFIANPYTQSELAIPIKYNGNTLGVFNSESDKICHYTSNVRNKVINLLSYLAISLSKLGYNGTKDNDSLPYIKYHNGKYTVYQDYRDYFSA
jgi:hypothetical protein